jgi:hypothetical protein
MVSDKSAKLLWKLVLFPCFLFNAGVIVLAPATGNKVFGAVCCGIMAICIAWCWYVEKAWLS